MRKFLANNWVIIVVGTALVLSLIVAVRNHFVIAENNQVLRESELVKERTREILSRTMHGLDLGVRGFSLTRGENMLIPYREAVERNASTFSEIEILLRQQQYNRLDQLGAVKLEVDRYIGFCQQMIETVKAGDTTQLLAMLKQDKGYDVWKKYDEFSRPLFEFEDKLHEQGLANYNAAIKTNLILQVSVVLLALPALLLFVSRIRKEREARQRLLLNVEENDRNYVFNSGVQNDSSADAVISTSIRNVRHASEFIKRMTEGDYAVNWNGLVTNNETLNKDTLAGNLVRMREQLKKVKEADEQRNWLNEGLAQFSEIVRNHQNNPKELAHRCVSYLSKYLQAQQCALFVLEGEGNDQHLQLSACYAFDKKKWFEKRVEIGDGLVGQTFLEGEPVQLKDIPNGYTKITSGLGEATPKHLLIVPLKYDVHTVAVLEIASFIFFENHHTDFLRKAGEFLASAILNSQTTNKMSSLLDQAHITEANMRQREEEMRQNMEELQATQEELIRKELEWQKKSIIV